MTPPFALGVIPARGGSKGLPGKNLLPLGGEPLLVHTIRAALSATELDGVICTTDSEEIASTAASAGATVVMRPADLAADDSPTEDALIHVLDTLLALGSAEPEYVVTLEPTSPLRSSRLIDECVARARDLRADAVITVTPSFESWGRLEDGVFRHLSPGEPRRRQLREPLYRESSTVYITRVAHLRRSGSVLADPLHAVVVDAEEAIDVNTAADLAVAEALFLARGGQRPT
jgi:N-acylneuraminate cytidylyltransferase